MRSMILLGALALAPRPAVAQTDPTAADEQAPESPGQQADENAPGAAEGDEIEGEVSTSEAEAPVSAADAPADTESAAAPSTERIGEQGDAGEDTAPGTALPEGTNPVDPIRAPVVAAHVDVSGFVNADFNYLRFDGGAYRSTFRPRELEITIDARWGDDTRTVLDVNWIVDTLSSSFQNTALDQKLVDALVQQGFAEWSPGAHRFVIGKMTAPMGYEALDVVDRAPLTRSNLSVLATPDHFTGVLAGTAINRHADAYLMVSNGWDSTVDDNRSKSFAAGLAHRLGQREGGRWFYEGSLDAVVGAEQIDTNDVRWLIDYWAEVQVRPCLLAIAEVVYAGEQGRGLSSRTGLPNSNQPATWWAASLTLDWQGKHAPRPGLEDWRVALRGEYLHDPDLAIDLPQLGGLNPMTTLLGLSATVRYALTAGLEAGVEYRADFERGDVENVSVQRNVPEFWNWFDTQQVTAAIIGRF